MGKLARHKRKALKSKPYNRAPETESSVLDKRPTSSAGSDNKPIPHSPAYTQTGSGYRGHDWVATLKSDYANHKCLYIDALKLAHNGDLFSLVYDLILCRPNIPPPAPPEDLVIWTVRHLGQLKRHDKELRHAMHTRKRYSVDRRSDRRRVIQAHLLFYSPQRFAILLGVTHLGVKRLPKGEEYPRRGYWIAETQEIFDLYESYLKNCELADKREKRHPVMKVDHSKPFIIPEELSCCLYDLDTGELFLVVIRKFGGNPVVTDWADRLARRGAVTRKSYRLDDTGHIFQVGFSAGNRKIPAFHLVRNWISHDGPEALDDQNRDIAGLFAWAWLDRMLNRAFFDNTWGPEGSL